MFRNTIIALAIGLATLSLAVPFAAATALGTAFTYQGQLTDGGSPATGTYDFQFKLYDASSSGGQIGSTVTLDNVSVADGMFTVSIDFGADRFQGDQRFLEVGVREGTSTGAYSTIPGRTDINPSPYALYAVKAENVRQKELSFNLGDSFNTYYANTNHALYSDEVGIGEKSYFTFFVPLDFGSLVSLKTYCTTDGASMTNANLDFTTGGENPGQKPGDNGVTSDTASEYNLTMDTLTEIDLTALIASDGGLTAGELRGIILTNNSSRVINVYGYRLVYLTN